MGFELRYSHVPPPVGPDLQRYTLCAFSCFFSLHLHKTTEKGTQRQKGHRDGVFVHERRHPSSFHCLCAISVTCILASHLTLLLDWCCLRLVLLSTRAVVCVRFVYMKPPHTQPHTQPSSRVKRRAEVPTAKKSNR